MQRIPSRFAGFFSALLFVAVPLFLSATEKEPLRDTIPFRQVYSFTPYPGEAGRHVNHFLQKIAEGSGKLRVVTTWSVFGNLYYRLMPSRQGGGCILELSLGRTGVSGDSRYGDFSLAEVLVPDLLSFQLGVYDAQWNPLAKVSRSPMKLEGEGQVLLILPLGRSCGEGPVRVEPGPLTFYYSDGARARFDNWFQILETYYGGGELLGRADSILSGLSPGDPDRLLLDEFLLCEAEQLLARFDQAAFLKAEGIRGSDPEDLLPWRQRLSALAGTLRLRFNQGIAGIDSLYHAAGRQALSDTLPGLAEQHFRAALVYNPFHSGANLGLAALEHEQLHHREALRRLGDMLGRHHPVGGWLGKTRDLSGLVLDSLFSQAREALADGRFLEGLDILGEVERFCGTAAGWYPCPPALDVLLREAHRGMFQSFMTVSHRAFRNDNLDYCLTYVRSAMDYQQAWMQYLPDRSEAMLLLQMIVNRHLQKGDALRDSGQTEAAGYHHEAARALCGEFPFLICDL
jgi:hypothetical protein